MQDVHAALETCRMLEHPLQVLAEVSSSLSEFTARLQAKARAATLHFGLNSLPSELLAYIIELACEYPMLPDHVKYSSVNRRFREIVIAHSKLWTYISNEQSNSFRALQLSRSGDHGIFVKFVISRRPSRLCDCEREAICERCASFLTSIKRNTRRWQFFRLAVDHGDIGNGQTIVWPLRKLKKLKLPKLEHVVICPAAPFLNFRKIFSSWSMPKLRAIDCFPEFLGGVTDRLGVTSLNVDFHEFAHASQPMTTHADTLLKALSPPAMSNLKDLTIKFSSYDMSYEPRIARPAASVPLPNLRSLTLGKCHFPPLVDILIDHILSRLDMQFLQSLSFMLDVGVRGDDDIILLQWLEDQRFKYLADVHVTLREHDKEASKMMADIDERIKGAFLPSVDEQFGIDTCISIPRLSITKL